MSGTANFANANDAQLGCGFVGGDVAARGVFSGEAPAIRSG